MAPSHQPRKPSPAGGVLAGFPPGDLVADAVGLDRQAALGALVEEPGGRRALGRCPATAVVAPGRGIPADRGEIRPQLLERLGHANSFNARTWQGVARTAVQAT